MRSAKEVFNAARYMIGRTTWQSTDGPEWNDIGEPDDFRAEVLLVALERVAGAGPVYVIIDRHTCFECLPQEALRYVHEQLLKADVVICDPDFRRCITILSIGVFRLSRCVNHRADGLAGGIS